MIKLTLIYFNELIILMSSKRYKVFLQILSSEGGKKSVRWKCSTHSVMQNTLLESFCS